MNLYQYCLNNPVNFKDPYGLLIKGRLGGAASAVGTGLLYIEATTRMASKIMRVSGFHSLFKQFD